MVLTEIIALEQKLAGPFVALSDAPPYDDTEVRLTRGDLTMLIRALHLFRAVNIAVSNR